MAANFIQLTHRVNGKSVPVYVNVDQICGVRDSVGGGSGYPTNIMLAGGAVDVSESVAEVMQKINQPGTAVAARARRSATK
jgi:hypothetical protein